MIEEYLKGHHSNNLELEEDYLDWFFMSYYGKDLGWWKGLSEDKIEAFVTLENDKEKRYWETWVGIFKKMFS